MDVALSDVLTCPRCGPGYGLILRPDEVVERRVVAGVLGCANCRERYEVSGGVADLRVGVGVEGPEPGDAGPPDAGVWSGGNGEAGPEPAVRLAALLGLEESGGTVLLAGPAAGLAAGLSALVPEVRLVWAVGSGAAPQVDRVSGAGPSSVVRVAGRLPVRSGSLRGVALTRDWTRLLAEGARAVGPGGRVVVEPAPADARQRLESAGLDVLLEEGDVLVAGRRAGRAGPGR